MYIVNESNGFEIFTKTFSFKDEAVQFMRKKFAAYVPGLWNKSDESLSHIDETGAILFAGDTVYVWTITEIKNDRSCIVSKMRQGTLVAETMPDPAYPGIDIEFHTGEETVSNPRVLIEYPQDGNELRVLIWNDRDKEDYTTAITLYRKEES